MNIRPYIRHALLTASLLTGPLAYGSDLAEVYQHALRNDPQIREAEANRLASLESKPQALAALLPQVSADGYYQSSDSNGSRTITSLANGQPVVGSVNYDSEADTKYWELGLRQSIFKWENWVALRQADSAVAQAESDYRAAEQDLVQRAAERYFNVLAARDTLVAAQATYEALGRQLEQSEKRFEVGLIAVTDVQESKAAYDSATAAVISAKRALASQQEQLRELTGQTFDELTKPGDKMPLGLPDPADQEAWVKLAMEQNARLISARLAADITREQISAEQGGHLPQVDLLASRGNNDLSSDSVFDGASLPSDADSTDTTWSLRFTLPIYSGGYTSSRVRQAEYRHRASRERLESTVRQTERSTRDSYLGVMAEQARVKALAQAVESAKTALQATEAGYEVGTRTTVEVLDSRRRLFEAETNYARSRYDYIINIIKLRLAAGTLDAKSIAEVNGWLTDSVSVKY